MAVVGITISIYSSPESVPAAVSETPVMSEKPSDTVSENSLTPSFIPESSVEIKEVDTSNILFGKGVTVEGVDLSGMSLSDAYYAMEETLNGIRDTITISIKCDGKTLTLTENDFKFDTDISDVLIQAYHYSRKELDTPTVSISENNGVTDFNVTSIINNASVNAAVKKAAEYFDIKPVQAHVVSFDPSATEKFTYADGSNGYLVDRDELSDKINNILSQDIKTGSFSIETKETPYTIKLADIKANTKLIASHSTKAVNVWASVHNMELALESANGVEVKPGETFSFNGTTGNTTNGDLGYVPSTAIVGGKYEQQYGGGICQASTTIYLCAVKADMEIVERYAHQYASSYADRGLDATVDYGNLDMKFKNTGKYSIYIATYSYDYDYDGYDELMVEMYGSPSTEYDEIVPVGWVTTVGSSSYSAKGAKVYFKDGKEVKREYLPSGSYDFHGEGSGYIYSLMPDDVSYGPVYVSPTMSIPTIYSPNGCGSNAPIPYGTAGDAPVEESSESKPDESSVSSISQVSVESSTIMPSNSNPESSLSHIQSSIMSAPESSVNSNPNESSVPEETQSET